VKTTFAVSAPPGAWAALADPERLAAALPGCRSVAPDAESDGVLHVVTEVAVASVRGLWAGTVAPVDADAVHVRGSGASGAVDLVVRADPERITLTVEGSVDGALGTVGTAVLAAAVRRMAEDLLGASEPPTPADSRGHEPRPDEPGAVGSGSRAHDLAPDAAEPVTSGTKGRRAAGGAGGAALVGAVFAVVAVIVRRRAQRRAG
jgi:carbon monoxide dehydrogenase subunit G